MTRSYAVTSDAGRPSSGAKVVTPSDDPAAQFETTLRLFLGTGGDLTVVMPKFDGPVTFKNAPQGYNDLQVYRVMFTGTAAQNILALY